MSYKLIIENEIKIAFFFLQVLTVSVVIPHRMQTEIYKCVRTKYFKQGLYSKEREDLLTSALDEAFTKKSILFQCT